MTDGQAEEIGVHHLPMTDQQAGGDGLVRQPCIVRPKHMVFMRDNLAEEGQRLFWGYGFPNDLFIGRNPHK